MGLRDASGKEKIVIFSNALIRFVQVIVAAAALGVYGTQKGYWLDHGLPSRIDYVIAVGVLALLTALIFGIIPFFLSYRIVALGAPWDIILMILWGAAFGVMRAIFLHDYTAKTLFKVSDPTSDRARFLDHWGTMMRSAWISLAGLILFLISGIMGLVLFFIGRRSGGGKGYA